MLTVHIAGTPEHGVQRCFRCNRVLTDNRRAAVAIEEGAARHVRPLNGIPPDKYTLAGLSWWQPGAFIGVTHDTFPIYSTVMERDAAENDREERSCQCPDADQDIALGQVMPGSKQPQ